MSTLFTLPEPENYPAVPDDVPVYNTMKYLTLARGEENLHADLKTRVDKYSKLFNINGTHKELGQRYVLQSGNKKLEIFRASDSFRFMDNNIRFLHASSQSWHIQ